ncbi:hypothetical protein BpHYR1_026526 [Brachionus plicatilis]|uniref:Uncharacterized protein n=1 Tax=Brachionus plicatilis TaxID=10195 RepID=A0A3M7QUV1_BRAPC|nr:hypothetical protein BpHYR1_026526 [Brachionus plicatilis]
MINLYYNVLQNSAVCFRLKLKYDTPSNNKALNKLKLLTVSHRLVVLSKGYVGTGLEPFFSIGCQTGRGKKSGFQIKIEMIECRDVKITLLPRNQK